MFKTSWLGTFEDLTYFATISPRLNDVDDEGEEERDRAESDGAVVEDWLHQKLADFSQVTADAADPGPLSAGACGGSVPDSGLQRVVARCRCDFSLVEFSEEAEDEVDEAAVCLASAPPRLSKANSRGSLTEQEEQMVNNFTLLHEDLFVSTNSFQYSVVLDIVNHLLLFVEPMALIKSDSYLRLKYRLMLSKEDLKKPITHLQHSVSQVLHELRTRETELRDLRDLGKAKKNDASAVEERAAQLEREVRRLSASLAQRANELRAHVSCLSEVDAAGGGRRQQPALASAGKEELWKRWTILFPSAQWRLTEADGQLGVADVFIEPFQYAKLVTRGGQEPTTEHILQISDLGVRNLLKNQLYSDVLYPTEQREKGASALVLHDGARQQTALRIFCRERPPVGGIAVLDHFEVNVVPLSISLTHAFYKKIVAFAFPGESARRSGSKKKRDDVNGRSNNHRVQQSVVVALLQTDDVEEMRQRAKLNKLFTYIKVPAVPICVSFKGEKDGILDVNDFLLQVPMLEYHNMTWTWYDLLLAVKSQTRDSLMAQAIKKKILSLNPARRRTRDDTAAYGGGRKKRTDQEKTKMLLGNLDQ